MSIGGDIEKSGSMASLFSCLLPSQVVSTFMSMSWSCSTMGYGWTCWLEDKCIGFPKGKWSHEIRLL